MHWQSKKVVSVIVAIDGVLAGPVHRVGGLAPQWRKSISQRWKSISLGRRSISHAR
jgi:hypothetical protein